MRESLQDYVKRFTKALAIYRIEKARNPENRGKIETILENLFFAYFLVKFFGFLAYFSPIFWISGFFYSAKKDFFPQIDSHDPDSRCESPGHLSFIGFSGFGVGVWASMETKVRGSFCESSEVPGFLERGVDLWGMSGELPATFGELLGKSGKLPGNLPRGPNDQKIWSRSKFSISIEIFDRARKF